MKSAFLLICLTFLLHVQEASAEVSYLKYPGGGIPLFSNDKPVKILNNKIIDFFSVKQGFDVADERIKFKDIKQDITLNTNLSIKNENLTIKNVFELTQGKISILIGNIEYQITPNQSSIFEGKKLVHTAYDTATKGIEFNRGYDFENKVVSIAYLTTVSLNSGEYVSTDFPAFIAITIHQGSTGSLGQWYWGRGSK